LGSSFENALSADVGEGPLGLGCIASHGHFLFDAPTSIFLLTNEERAATAFLFKLTSLLQFRGTVPMIDIEAYAKWLVK
jgi:hypothetical protein